MLVAVVIAVVFAAGAGAADPTTAEGYLKRGKENFNSFEFTKAIADFTKAIELDKGLVEAYKQRAAIYEFFSVHAEAVADYTAVINLTPQDLESRLARGRAYGALGKADEAIADFTFVLQKDQKYAAAYTARANVYAHQKKFDQATADFDKLIEVAPSVANYQARAYYHLHYRKDLKATLADYTAVITLEPNIPGHYHNRAAVHAENGDADAAVADFTAAIKLVPKDYFYHAARGRLHLGKGRLDDAIADYTAAIALNPNPYYYLHLGEAERRKGNPERATADFNKAIEHGLWLAGRVYLYQLKLLPDILSYDEHAQLVEAEEAIRRKPKDAEGYIRRAATLGDSTKSVADYTTALKLAPERAAAIHVCRGAAYQTAGRYASAVADYREALQIEPSMKLAETLLNSGIAKMTEYKSKTILESVRLDQEIILVTNSFKEFTYPDGEKKEESNTLTVKREVTVADVRRIDTEVRAAQKQKSESVQGSSSSSKTGSSDKVEGGGSVGKAWGVLSFSGSYGHTWDSSSETGYTSSTLTGWESEFSTSIRKGIEVSRSVSVGVESGEGQKITVTGKGKDRPIRVIYLDKYRTGTAKFTINGVVDEVRFAFPVGKDITWEYVEKPKSEEKK